MATTSAPTSSKPAASKKSAPVKTFRFGLIKAAIWANPSEDKTYYSVTFTRSFKKDEQWHESDSYGRDDLPLLEKLADKCHEWIYETLATTKAD